MGGNVFSITLPAAKSSADRVIDGINSFALSAGIAKETLDLIDIAVDEVCANIISYAYTDSPVPGNYTVKAFLEGSSFTLVFSDSGTAFNPLEAKEPELGGEPKVGGLGIFFCRNIMNGMSYRRVGNVNELTMFKQL